MKTAKLFWTGRSQAVRLPKEFQFSAAKVRIRRHGNGVILEPVAENWSWLDVLGGPLDEDFVEGVNERPPRQA
jgi:antitoxin VapB